MVKKLISFLQKETAWKLLGKAVAASAALGLLAWAGFRFWPILIFFSVILFIYFSETAERRSLRFSFWLAVILSFLGMWAVSIMPEGFPGGMIEGFLIVALGAIAFAVLGLINLFFRNRVLVHNLLNTALAAYLFVLIFYFMPSSSNESVLSAIAWLILLFLSVLFLIRETLVFGESARGRNLRLTVWSLAIIISEIAVFAALMPLGFVNAAAFLTLFFILGRDVVLARIRGFLNLSLVLKELTIFSVVLSLIFATVTWVLP